MLAQRERRGMPTHTSSIRRRAIVVLLAGLAICGRGTVASAADSVPIDFRAGNLTWSQPWDPGQGVDLRVEAADGGPGLRFQATARRVQVEPLGAPDFPAKGGGAWRHPERLPARGTETVRCTLQIRPDLWSLFVDERLVASCAAPAQPPLLVRLPPGVVADAARFQRVADFVFEDRFLIPAEDANALAGWEAEAGEWNLYSSAREHLIANRRKGRVPDPERSPNFYCLVGRGTNALLVAGHPFHDRYVHAAAVEAGAGEGGLVVAYEGPDRFLAFTMLPDEASQEALYRLWRPTAQGRETLGAVRAGLTSDQWVKLQVEVGLGRVRCRVDDTVVLDVPAELPSGGQYGLFAQSEAGLRFDDVTTHTDPDLRFDAPEWLRLQARFDPAGLAPAARQTPTGLAVPFPRDRTERLLILGPPVETPPVWTADLTLGGRADARAGLIAGWTNPQSPYLRFVLQRAGGALSFVLERVDGTTVRPLARLAPPAGLVATGETVRLLLDLSEPGFVRASADGHLVLLHALDTPQVGAAGLWMAAGSEGAWSDLALLREPPGVYRNRYEKNRIFAADPYMRHWSSPEGEWIAMPDGLTWHKGDFFGRARVALPIVPGGALHLGVPENASNGAFRVALEDRQLTLRALREDGVSWSRPLAYAPAPNAGPATNPSLFRVEVEDFVLRAEAGDRVLFQHALARPLEGRRMRVEGYSTAHLAFSHVDRYQVKDYLFTDSLHEWVQNGGQWQVVNRFQCDPRWSHMNGESEDGLAALWAKVRFGGDFCMEVYVGMRHGWYERAGDLNITMFNDVTSPSRGYTVTATGWDVDQSQLLTRLYRNGAEVAQTDKYLVPRRREGLRREGYTPLEASGRPMHGAWYYLKFRRIGDRLTYTFDNETVFELTDDDPLAAGSAGIWTYRNSMMVARVKIAAERVEPLPMAFRRVASEEADAPVAPPARLPDDLRVQGRPRHLLRPEAWTVEDPVGRMRLSWHTEPDGAPYFATQSTLGAGPLFTRSLAEPRPLDALAGWRMRVQRTPGAQFNIHYTLGTLDAKGVYTPLRRFFHLVSGIDFDRGTFAMNGATAVPPVTRTGADWHAERIWTPVVVWIDTRSWRDLAGRKDLFVRFEGFGNLQPSTVQQGLTGNRPGDGYAIAGFSEILLGVPHLETAHAENPPERAAWLGENGREHAGGTLDELNQWLTGHAAPGWSRGTLRTTHGRRTIDSPLTWLLPPATAQVTVAWSPTIPGGVVFRSAGDAPDRRFLFGSARAAGQKIELAQESPTTLTALLPRHAPFHALETNHLELAFHTGEVDLPLALAWSDRPRNDVPVLLRLGGNLPIFLNFERSEDFAALAPGGAGLHVRNGDPEQGAFLRAANAGTARRLRANLPVKINLAHYPIFQFRYRGQGMVNVSLSLRDGVRARLNEKLADARPVRLAGSLLLDGQWHTWYGMVADAIPPGELRADPYRAEQLSLGSFNRVDQTGLFSEWDLDDLVFAPALSRTRTLLLQPEYFDEDGVAAVEWAVRRGEEPFALLTPDALATLAWVRAAPGASIEPDPGALADGIGRIFLRAIDRRHAVSAVTEIPFLLDTQPIDVQHEFEPAAGPLRNDTILRVRLLTGGAAPLDPTSLSIGWEGAPRAAATENAVVQRGRDADELEINWPYVFRREIDAMPPGATNAIVIDGIADGAGNVSAPYRIPVLLPTSDSTPPTPTALQCGTNVYRTANWGWRDLTAPRYPVVRADTLSVLADATNGPFLRLTSREVNGGFTIPMTGTGWNPAEYPWLAFRIRSPVDSPVTNTRVTVTLANAEGKRYNLALMGSPATNELAVPAPIRLPDAGWQTVLVNVQALIDPSARATEIEGLFTGVETTTDAEPAVRVDAPAHKPAAKPFLATQVQIRHTSSAVGARLDIQNMCMLAPWTDEPPRFDAFDVGGVRGVTVDMETTTRLPAGQAGGAAADGGWMVLRAVDRAGNASWPSRLPWFGASKPVSPQNAVATLDESAQDGAALQE